MIPKLTQKSMRNERDSRKINVLGSLAAAETPRFMQWWTHWGIRFTFSFPPGIHDSAIAEDVMDHVELEPNETTVLADKAYGSFEFREYIANRDADFCIPPKSNSVDPWYCDFVRYKERHVVECFFNKLKENRRIATRFDKLAHRFLAFVHLGCIRILLA
jgi:transposase